MDLVHLDKFDGRELRCFSFAITCHWYLWDLYSSQQLLAAPYLSLLAFSLPALGATVRSPSADEFPLILNLLSAFFCKVVCLADKFLLYLSRK
jgi:hypothetical protein